MKRLLLFFLVLFVLSSCSELTMISVFHGNESKWTEAKKEEVPALVLESFKSKYPNANVDKWYRISKSQFVASFQKDNNKTFAIISANGVLNTEYLNDIEDMFGYDDFDDYIDSDYYY